MRRVALACACLLLSVPAGAQERPRRLAVLLFGSGGLSPETADGLTEVLIASLVAHGNVEVVGKEEFEAQLGSDQAQTEECLSSTSCLGRVGVRLGVDEVVAGSVGPRPGGGYTMSVDRIDVATGQTLGHVFRPVEGDERALSEAVQASAAQLHDGATPPPPGAAPDAPARGHEGFYLRAALGAGRFGDDISGPLGFADGKATGASVSFELLAGGALEPGLVLAGGFFVEGVQDPQVEIEGVNTGGVSVGTLTAVGAMMDWYLNPDRGFHLQGALAGARITIKDEDDVVSPHEPAGGILVLGVGYEWWIAREWGLGVLGRLLVGTLSDDGFTHTVSAISVLGSATWN